MAGDATSATPSYFATGGNPGGYIGSTDSFIGGGSYWVASRRSARPRLRVRRALTALRQSDGSAQFAADDVEVPATA